MANHVQTVQHIYDCFMRGDVPGILATLSDNVTFFNGSDPKVAPFGGEFHGKDGVIHFFTALGSTTQTTRFEATNYRTQGNQVVNDVRHDGLATATGKTFSVNVLFTWTFNNDGMVASWRGTGDFSSVNNSLVK